MGNPFILHDSLHVRKVQIDDGRNINQIRDSLNRLLKHFIRFLKGIRHGGAPVHNLQQLVIGNYDQSIYIIFNLLDTVDCIDHTSLGLKAEGFGHNAYRQDSHILGKLGHNRGRPGSGSASHTAGNKYHICALKHSGNLLAAFLGSLLADLRLGAGPQSFGELLADLQKLWRPAELQSLLVRIDTDKLNACNTLVNHSIYSIITCAAYTNDYNLGCRFSFVRLNFQQEYFLLHHSQNELSCHMPAFETHIDYHIIFSVNYQPQISVFYP